MVSGPDIDDQRAFGEYDFSLLPRPNTDLVVIRNLTGIDPIEEVGDKHRLVVLGEGSRTELCLFKFNSRQSKRRERDIQVSWQITWNNDFIVYQMGDPTYPASPHFSKCPRWSLGKVRVLVTKSEDKRRRRQGSVEVKSGPTDAQQASATSSRIHPYKSFDRAWLHIPRKSVFAVLFCSEGGLGNARFCCLTTIAG
ncbi:hypothetical protein NL676_005983 [Syzygium grande]|nr:hypothetical protein NL676_005983 [Syzygium grande]